MGSALLLRLLDQKVQTASELVVWDSDRKKLDAAVKQYGIRGAGSGSDLAASAGLILLAVKPQQMSSVLSEIKGSISSKPLIVSIAAGIPIRWIQQRLGGTARVVRVMPNTPALVGAGMSAITFGQGVNKLEREPVSRIFESVGEVIEVDEDWMDAVTALSGSGPAYFFHLMEQMIDAGVKLGLDEKVSRQLVIQTAHGAVRLVKETGEDPGKLREKVTSKGGTTEAAFQVFAKRKLGQAFQEGIRAAAKRAKELSS